MNRPAKLFLGLLLIIGVTAVAAIAWLGGTSSGARTVLTLVSRFTPVSIEAQEVNGSLLRELQLREMRLTMPEKEIGVGRLRLLWLPHGLLSGRVLVNELSLEEVGVIDRAPPGKEPPQVVWPTVPRSFARWEARVELLRVDNLTYRHLQQQPVNVTRLSTSVLWKDGVVSLDGLDIATPSGNLEGRVHAGLVRPSLKTDLTIDLPRPVREMNRFSLTARLLPGTSNAEIVAGRLGITGAKGTQPQYAAEGDVGIQREAVNLRNLRMTRPGRQGSLTASGTIRLASPQPNFDLTLILKELDLKEETGTSTNLSATAGIKGTAGNYRGTITAANRGDAWRAGTVSALFSGTDTSLTLSRLSGSLVGGTVEGTLRIGWQEGISAKGTLAVRGLNPGMIDKRWHGSIHSDMAGEVVRSRSGAVSGRLTGTFRDSVFQGWPLAGEVDAEASGRDIWLRRLALRGNGFDLTAAGDLSRRILFSANVVNLAPILPGAAGRAVAKGWVRWSGGIPSGAVDITGADIRIAELQTASGHIACAVDGGKAIDSTAITMQGTMEQVRYQDFGADTVSLDLRGTVADHVLTAAVASPGTSIRLGIEGGYADKRWHGQLTRFAGRDRFGEWSAAAPATVSISPTRLALSDLVIQGTGGERLAFSGDVRLNPLRGTVLAEWRNLVLERANPWLQGMRVEGRSSGSVAMAPSGDRFTLAGDLAAKGTVTYKDRRITVSALSLSLDWREMGLTGQARLDLDGKGTMTAQAASSSPPVFSLPTTGDLDIRWENLDLALLGPWLPARMEAAGLLDGRITAKILPGNKFDMLGKATVRNGLWRVNDTGNTISTSIRTFDASWSWRDEGLRGGMTVELARWGKARGSFAIPITAAIPLRIDQDTPLQAHAAGQVQELGLLAAFYPGMVQEAHGDLGFDITLGGTMGKPEVRGSIELAKGGGYIPAAGIRISDTRLHAVISRERIDIDTMRVVSGPGYLEGAAVVQLGGGEMTEYSGSIRGDGFEALNLPELQGLVSPRLEFQGTPERLVVTGDILIPELRVRGEAPQAPVQPSRDVIIVDAPPGEQERRLAIELDVGITLGEHVTVKTKGIDAQLKGGVRISGSPAELSSRGEIRVVKGRYKAYGIDLNITRGRIFYAGVALDQPTVDIVALRTVDEVKAGVTVGGTLQSPVVKLHSEPAMPDVDILAYIILGHPMGRSGEQATLVSRAAGALLSAGQSVALQDQLKSRLGLSTLEVQAGEEETGYMGYRPVSVGPAGAGDSRTGAGEIAKTTVSVGKYLTRKLYISYGRSIFTGTNIFRLRYDFSRQFQLETQAGAESGADLYYKVEFD